METEPIISVAMLVYNHEKYLDHALRSVFEQKINVPYEIVIGEDCSDDSSREIIERWRKQYPAIVKPIYREKNVGMERNTNEVLFSCEGEYVAWLEGDDFWTDVYKLQKQLDFLNKNHQYIGITHNTQVVDAEERPLPEHQKNYPVLQERDFTWKDFENGGMPGQTATFFYHNVFRKMTEEEQAIFYECHANGDSCIIGTLLQHGKIKILPDFMSAYRYVTVGGSNWNSITYGKNYALVYYQKVLELEKALSKLACKKVILKGWRYRSLASALLAVLRNYSNENREIFRKIWKMETHKVGGGIYCCKLAFKHLRGTTKND